MCSRPYLIFAEGAAGAFVLAGAHRSHRGREFIYFSIAIIIEPVTGLRWSTRHARVDAVSEHVGTPTGKCIGLRCNDGIRVVTRVDEWRRLGKTAEYA